MMLIVARRWFTVIALIAPLVSPAAADAADAVVIDARVDAALTELRETTPGAAHLIERAKGMLVMPQITKAGFIIGGEYGEGALRIGGVTEAYYSLAGGSVGFQAGVQNFSQVLLFMTDDALANFRGAEGWEAGVDAEVTLVKTGASLGADTTVTNQPIIALVFGQSGLLAGASVQGSKYSQIER